jgi:ribosome-binding ATPase YchF (GTP1/OBG family)
MISTSVSVGIIGKTNVGKSTFFSAATLIDVPIENRPFVTLSPNIGIGYVKVKCVHTELGVICNPK